MATEVKIMEKADMARIAAKFSVRIANEPPAVELLNSYDGCIVLVYIQSDVVENVLFDEKRGRVRLLKLDRDWIEGDYAVAIAVALTRRYPGPNDQLVDTIRIVGAIIE
jgi:hypothetical protein